MSQLEDATQRLDAAIARLEQAVAAGANQGAALDDAERENAELRGQADAALGRLDKVIDRLKSLLEN